jgi:host factor-I protein
MKNQLSMQDQFLNRVRRDQIRVVIDLVTGGQLEGEIVSFDNFSLILRGEEDRLVYKHAISTISAGKKLEPLEK